MADQLMELMSKMALHKWKGKQDRQTMLANMAIAKSLLGKDGEGLDMGEPDVSEFAKKRQPSYHMKGLDLKTGMPQIGFRTPEERETAGFQSDVGRFQRAKQFTKALPEREKETTDIVRKLGITDPSRVRPTLRKRMQQKMGAEAAIKELKPRFGGKQFQLTEKGKYKEAKPTLKKGKTPKELVQEYQKLAAKEGADIKLSSLITPEKQADVARKFYSEVMRQKQARKEKEKVEKITLGHKKALGLVKAMKKQNAPLGEILQVIELSGYDPTDNFFYGELEGYEPVVPKKKRFGIF